MRVSVVIPCYNREASIGAAIGSALRQQPAPLEVIVVDDGSTDGSAAAAARYGDPVRVVRTPNRGPSAARNTGIDEARGDWIAFLDSDDLWLPDKLRLQAEAAAAFDAPVVFCDTQTRRHDRIEIESRFALGGVRGAERERRGELLLFDRSLFGRLLEESRVFTSTVLVRRDLPELRFAEHLKGPEDWALWLRLALHHPFAAVDRVLVHMYYEEDNLTARYGPILRGGVTVLEELLRQEELAGGERRRVEAALGRRRLGALYHTLAEGDTRQARPLVAAVEPRRLGRARWLAYWLASRLPGGLVRALAARRRTA